MSFRGISAILLFSFTIPIVMKHRIFPMEGTPYWLFGVLFFSLIGYSLLSIYPELILNLYKLKNKKSSHSALSLNILVERMRTILLLICLGISLGGASITAIADRHRIAPVWGAHDIILQQEAAMRYLLQGKNPYKETYFGTPVEMFRYEEMGNPNVTNPALYHFVMPPAYLLVPFPFYWVANRLFGYFDGRMVLIVLMIAVVFFLSRWFKRRDIAELAIILTAISPATTDYFIEGRSDLFPLAFLLGSLFFLNKRTLYISVCLFALAVLSKQTMWFATPFYLAYVFVISNRSWKKMIGPVGVLGAVSLLFLTPFLIWDAKAFFDSVILYLSAGGEKGYPISGYGLSMILYSLGHIKGLHDYYPFLVWQGLFGMVTILVSLWVFLKKPSMSIFFVGFALTLFSFWYTSRYFNNSHIAVVAGLFCLGILKKYDEQTYEEI